jgi:hypothetical protein
MLLSAGEAQRLTQRIKLTASSVRDGLFKLRNLVEEAKRSNVWQVLGFQSWTAYLADTLADEPMRLGRDERQELVGYLSGEGLSTRAIAPIVGASVGTVHADIAGVQNRTPAPEPEVAADPVTGEVIEDAVIVEEPRKITGLDGKTYSPTTPKKPNRRALTDTARDAGWDIRKATERLERVTEDDRYTRNKNEVAELLRGHLVYVIETCQGILDDLNQKQENKS